MNKKNTKTCSICKKKKDVEEFNRDKQQKDGRYPYCKECRKPLLKRWAKTYKEKHKIMAREWEKKNREAKRAHKKVLYAINNGKLKRPIKCTECKSKGDIEAHHKDYKCPLIVIWLCPRCHKKEHFKNYGK